jgi:hypothetical protein
MSELTLTTQEGTKTSLTLSAPQLIAVSQMEAYQDLIEHALNAKPEEFKDVTPIYWEARTGETKIMVLLGFKPINVKDEKTGEITGQSFAVVFFDGSREVVCNQISLKDAMKNKNQGSTFKITCISAVAKQAKKFEILELQQSR